MLACSDARAALDDFYEVRLGLHALDRLAFAHAKMQHAYAVCYAGLRDIYRYKTPKNRYVYVSMCLYNRVVTYVLPLVCVS